MSAITFWTNLSSSTTSIFLDVISLAQLLLLLHSPLERRPESSPRTPVGGERNTHFPAHSTVCRTRAHSTCRRPRGAFSFGIDPSLNEALNAWDEIHHWKGQRCAAA